jgi:predicted secreted protein
MVSSHFRNNIDLGKDMFNDCRGKKIVFLAHCVLNQNAKLDRCAHHQGAITKLINVLLENGIGIVQLECPEMLYLGLDRESDSASISNIESEDTRIADRMAEHGAQAIVDRIARNTVQQIVDYQKNGFIVLGLIGINGSPTCGVETTWANGHEPLGQGVLISSISRHLRDAGQVVPMRGIKALDVDHAVETILEIIHASGAPPSAGGPLISPEDSS